MGWFGRKKRPRREPQRDRGVDPQRELLDPDHHRASVVDGDALLVDPAKVRANLALAIERIDLDVDTAVSLEDDVVALDELAAMIRMGLGSVLITDTVNTAARVMLARYPHDLVRRPLAAHYDLRQIYPVSYTDDQHARAVAIVNRRAGRVDDLHPVDPWQPDDGVDDLLEGLDEPDVIQVFTAVFFISMSKIGALKRRSGIE